MIEATPSWRDGLVLLYCPLEENMSVEALQKIIDESAAIAFFGGAGFESRTAGAGHRDLVIIGMDIFFHILPPFLFLNRFL